MLLMQWEALRRRRLLAKVLKEPTTQRVQKQELETPGLTSKTEWKRVKQVKLLSDFWSRS